MESVLLGPFAVDPVKISQLGPLFTDFVNSLLDAERARSGILGWQLHVDSQTNTRDGGVDAALEGAVETDWLPPGDSAWQFKSGPFGPTACANELEEAQFARDLLQAGATYIMAIGVRLGSRLIREREKFLRNKASELGIALDAPTKIRVIDANAMARWASEFFSISVSELFQAPGWSVRDYAQWSGSSVHGTTWVDNAAKAAAIDHIRSDLADPTKIGIRIQDESGMGKTRLVMQALSVEPWPSFVAYIPDSRNIGSDVLSFLLSTDRLVVLVVDECDARDHDKLLEQIPASTHLKLITIGEPSAYPLLAPAISVGRVETQDVETFLSNDFGTLWAEARRVVAENCNGNIRWAQIIATRIRALDPTHAADLIREGDIETFVSDLLPAGGRSFFTSGLIALAERVGWDGELATQMESLARFGNVDMAEMEQLARELERGGLLVRQGRYRAIAPRPLAVFLAAAAWREHGERIITDLLPTLDRDMTMSLLTRAAQLGGYPPSKIVLERLTSSSGPFGSLRSIEENGLSDFLTQLAIISPEATIRLLVDLIEAEPIESLRLQSTSRRGLVWTLEKLAWHSRTFESAADCLLQLALAENESYANNATGTWVALFGAALPATAATPTQRLEYLDALSRSKESELRSFAVLALTHAIAYWESVTVSAEIQGGVLVEPRGGVTTDVERGAYRLKAISILKTLSHDQSESVASSSSDVLLKALHPLIDDPYVGAGLADALVELSEEHLDELHQSIAHLRGLFRRTRSRPTVEAALTALTERLPPQTREDELRILLNTNPWELDDGEQGDRLIALVRERALAGDLDTLLEMLTEEVLPGAWQAGRALSALPHFRETVVTGLVGAAGTNPAALGGYLSGLVELGDESAFDSVLDSQMTRDVPRGVMLSLSVQGAATDSAKDRVRQLIEQIPVVEGSRRLAGWHHKVPWSDLSRCLSSWLPRIATVEDYEAVVDWLTLVVHGSGIRAEQEDQVWELVQLREEYPELGSARWAWGQLALHNVPIHPVQLGSLILDIVDSGQMVMEVDDEAGLLRGVTALAPSEVWGEVGRRLEGSDWRLAMHLRGWFVGSVPLNVIADWIGNSDQRAKLVANIASAGSAEPSPLARHLLSTFEDDEDVSAALAAEFLSGSWSGPASGRYALLISQLESWRNNRGELVAVKRWAGRLIEDLQRSRDESLQREAERQW